MVECGVCGTEFKRSNQRRKYCSDDCKVIGYKLKEQEYNKQYAAQWVESGKSREYYEANRDRMIAHTRKWQEANKDKVKQIKINGRIKAAAYSSRRRALERNTSVEDVDFNFIAERDKMICWLCLGPIEDGELAFDHAIALVLGGTHTVDNIYCSHRLCNSKKHARALDSLEELFPNINRQILQKLTKKE